MAWQEVASSDIRGTDYRIASIRFFATRTISSSWRVGRSGEGITAFTASQNYSTAQITALLLFELPALSLLPVAVACAVAAFMRAHGDTSDSSSHFDFAKPFGQQILTDL